MGSGNGFLIRGKSGLGYMIISITYAAKAGEKVDLISYGRFFWTHQDGDNAMVDRDIFRFRTMTRSESKRA